MTDGLENRLNRISATPFMLAAKGVDHRLMRILADHGADPPLRNADNTTALMLAAGTNIVDLGKDSGTDDDALEAVKLVWSLTNLINESDDQGETPLHGAAFRGAEKVVRFLIEKGAKLDAKTNIGWTPLTVAHGILYNGDIRTQPTIIANIDRRDEEARTEGIEALNRSMRCSRTSRFRTSRTSHSSSRPHDLPSVPVSKNA